MKVKIRKMQRASPWRHEEGQPVVEETIERLYGDAQRRQQELKEGMKKQWEKQQEELWDKFKEDIPPWERDLTPRTPDWKRSHDRAPDRGTDDDLDEGDVLGGVRGGAEEKGSDQHGNDLCSDHGGGRYSEPLVAEELWHRMEAGANQGAAFAGGPGHRRTSESHGRVADGPGHRCTSESHGRVTVGEGLRPGGRNAGEERECRG